LRQLLTGWQTGRKSTRDRAASGTLGRGREGQGGLRRAARGAAKLARLSAAVGSCYLVPGFRDDVEGILLRAARRRRPGVLGVLAPSVPPVALVAARRAALLTDHGMAGGLS